MRWRPSGWFLVRVLLAAAIVALALAVLDIESLLRSLRRLSWQALFWAALFNVLTVLLLTWRWYFMVRRFVPGSLWWHARHYWTSVMLNVFTPAALGSDVYRIVLLRGAEAHGSSLLGLILQERIVGLLGQALFFLGCLAWAMAAAAAGGTSLSPVLTSAGWMLALVVLAILLSFWTGEAVSRSLARLLPGRWATRARQLGAAFRPTSVSVLAVLTVFTLASVLTWALAVAAITADLAADIAFPRVGLVAVLGEIARWLPLSLQGIGTREAVYALCFELLAESPEAGFLTGAAVYLVNTVVLLLFGGVTIGYGWRKDRVT